jgi:hypothetical protein
MKDFLLNVLVGLIPLGITILIGLGLRYLINIVSVMLLFKIILIISFTDIIYWFGFLIRNASRE